MLSVLLRHWVTRKKKIVEYHGARIRRRFFFFLAKRRMFIDDLTVPPAETYYLKRNIKAKYSHEQTIDGHSVTYE